MTDLTLWFLLTGLFVLWGTWPSIKARLLAREIRKQSEVERARERSKRIHPSNRE